MLKTHQQYLIELEEKNINVIPLKKYTKGSEKILHECICGNTWDVTPKHVLRNVTCGCKLNPLRSNTEKYREKLKKLNIKTESLEEYKGTKTKTLHKCVCGQKWEIKPEDVYKGTTCGCANKKNKAHTIETYRNRKTILYYLKIDNLYKIGIAIHEQYKDPIDTILKYRYSGKKYKDYAIDILDYKVFEDGSEAYLLEKLILNKYDKFRYVYVSESMNNFGGYTELFTKNILSNT